MPRLELFREDHMQKAYGIYLLKPSHSVIRKMRKSIRPSEFGQKTWGSSFLAIDWLAQQNLAADTRLLEIGCGWAPIAIYAASQIGLKATGMDIDDSVFPYMDVHSEMNDCRVKALHSSYADLTSAQLSKYDLLIGADICYWDNLIDELLAMFERAFAAGVQQIIIADPGRSTFVKLCDLCEQLWPEHFVHEYWYALEPKRMEGQLLILANPQMTLHRHSLD